MTSNFVGGSSHISRVIWDLHQENVEVELPSGKHTKNYGKSQFLMGKLTISMAILNSYVKLPEGICNHANEFDWFDQRNTVYQLKQVVSRQHLVIQPGFLMILSHWVAPTVR